MSVSIHPSEATLIPYSASPLPDVRKVLVLAPHPDDEVFGCGGAIALHVQAGHQVQVILLTAGDHGDAQGPQGSYSQNRLQESAAAAGVLGLPAPQCWYLPDRGVVYGEPLIAQMLEAIQTWQADLVYAPSPWELHPDHVATSMAALEAVRRLQNQPCALYLYEVSAALRPNRLLDIAAVWPLKQQAMAAFASQEAKLPYGSFIAALNHLRTLTLQPHTQVAEAFEAYNATDLRAGGPLMIGSERLRLLSQAIAVLPQDMPLVSVIVRTLGRSTLGKALHSLQLQTYRHLEVLLVDAAGTGLPTLPPETQGLAVRVVSQGQRLQRTRAANVGLQAATGQYLLFLDDDDWLYPDHIAKLVQCLRQSSTAQAAHTAVECVNDQGEPAGEVFDFAYAPRELCYGNFMPIHAVLFARSLVQAGCLLDESFDLYEDWDFWLQLERHTPFIFVPGVSAAYRIHATAGAGVQVEPEKSRQATARLYAKWGVQLSESGFLDLIGRAVERRRLQRQLTYQAQAAAHWQQTCQRLGQEAHSLNQALQAEQQQALAALQAADQARQEAHHLRQAHEQACAHRDQVQQHRDVLQHSHQQVEQQRDQAQQQCAQLQQEQSVLQHSHQQVEQQRDHLQQLHDQLVQERQRLQQQLNTQAQTLLHTEQQRAHIEQAHARTEQELTQAQATTGQLAQEVARLQTELQLTYNHAAHLQRSWDASRNDVQAILSSTSWQVSKPVRVAGKLVRDARRTWAALGVARQRGMGMGQLLRRTAEVYQREGLAGVRQRAGRLLQTPSYAPAAAPESAATTTETSLIPPAAPSNERNYVRWVQQYDTLDAAALENLRQRVAQLSATPLVSLVMPVYNPVARDLQRAIASVQAQLYPHWELCICDDASSNATTRSLLEATAAAEPRIKLAFHAQNQHISHATNTAIALARGQYVGFLDHDDELRPHALLCAVEAFASHPQAKVLYSDEDKIDEAGNRFDPYFKPDFNLGLLRSHNYMCHFAVYERAFLNQIGGPRPSFEGAQDYDQALRAVDALRDCPGAVVHIPQILYHWRTAVGSTASGHGNKSYAFLAGQKALTEHLQRRGLQGSVAEAPEAGGMYRIRWQRPSNPPLVSIIIPTRNGQALVRQCLDSLRQTSYPRYEVILVDNGSDDPDALAFFAERETIGQIRVFRDDSPFNFSAINNHGIRQAAQGEFILMMNNDIEITHPEWLDEMVGPAMESGVGCVGARLWYPDGRLQHGGVVLVCGVAGHAHKYLPRGQHGYMGRAVLAQEFVAVTAACLLVRRSIYEEVGGLDESLAVAFNDVDFCLRVHEAGYRNHWTPYAELIHHESVSRGYEDTPEKQQRFKREIDTLQARWPHLLAHDPCYNPNLTMDAEDFSLAWPPRGAARIQ